MATVKQFVATVMEIVREKPVYRTGGTAADGTCDCVGLIMGAFARLGDGKFALHGSNYFARCEVEALGELEEQESCELGMIVFKAREAGEAGYDLPDRYQSGGSYDNGDHRDYYHVGVVTSMNPFMIVHCTTAGNINGIRKDFRLGEWRYGGKAKRLKEEAEKETEGESLNKTALVKAEKGSTVMLRKKASVNSVYLAKVPIGDKVTVQETLGEWASVRYQDKTGYMKLEFLDFSGEEEESAAQDEAAERLSCMEEKLCGVEDKLSSSEERLCSAEEKLCSTEERLCSTEEKLCGVEDKLSSSEERLSNMEMKLCSTEEKLCSTEERLCSTEERLCSTEEKLCSMEEKLCDMREKLLRVLALLGESAESAGTEASAEAAADEAESWLDEEFDGVLAEG